MCVGGGDITASRLTGLYALYHGHNGVRVGRIRAYNAGVAFDDLAREALGAAPGRY